MTDEQPSQKRCSKCGETKSLDAFAKNNRTKDGRKYHCKACVRQYYDANAESIREKSRAHYAANAESISEKNRAYYET